MMRIMLVREMLTYRRPARSATEAEFIARYLDTVPGMYSDGYGNRILPCADARVMISCHTDSVHCAEGRQRIAVSRSSLVSLADAGSNCLGADDAAGIYAALRMIDAGVKATFVFHRDEESGGKGSSWIARNYPEWLRTFDICLALDRLGTDDIVTHQRFSRTASDRFAAGLAKQIGMKHAPADGIFTDSANYAALIPECSNISVGYRREHSRDETLDLRYLESVIRALIRVKWDEIPIARDPGACDPWESDLWEPEPDPDPECVCCGDRADNSLTCRYGPICAWCWETQEELR